jgi:sec-independent protein translocase protein TatA
MGGAFSLSHVILVVLVLVLLFGAHKIPELMRSLGSGLTEFKRGMDQGPKESKDPAEPPKS